MTCRTEEEEDTELEREGIVVVDENGMETGGSRRGDDSDVEMTVDDTDKEDASEDETSEAELGEYLSITCTHLRRLTCIWQNV